MTRLRDFFSSLSALKDWQDDVERALTAPAQTHCSPRAATPYAPQEPVVIKRDALILDLCAYREKKAISA